MQSIIISNQADSTLCETVENTYAIDHRVLRLLSLRYSTNYARTWDQNIRPYTLLMYKFRWLSKSKVLSDSRVFELSDQHRWFILNQHVVLWHVLTIRLGAVNLHARLTFLNRWMHWIRVCNAAIDIHVVFLLKFWNLLFERFGSSPNVVLWLYSMTCFDCPCVVARGVDRNKYRVLRISGGLHWIWTYFHTGEAF